MTNDLTITFSSNAQVADVVEALRFRSGHARALGEPYAVKSLVERADRLDGIANRVAEQHARARKTRQQALVRKLMQARAARIVR